MKLWILKTVGIMAYLTALVCLALWAVSVAATVANTTTVGGLCVLLAGIYLVSLGVAFFLDLVYKPKESTQCAKKSCCSSSSASQSSAELAHE